MFGHNTSTSLQARPSVSPLNLHRMAVVAGTLPAMAAECDAIIEGKLYVGNYASAQDADLLNGHNVTHIISAGFRVGHFSTASSAPTSSSKYRYLCIDVRDDPNENLLRHLPRATTFIQKALDDDGGGCVFVHCVHGQSRSCAIVVAYLMRMCWEQSDQSDNDDPRSLLHRCYHQVETARPCMAINPGFVRQLEVYRRMICCDSGCGSSSLRHALTPPMSRAHAAFRSFRARSEYVESGRISKWFPMSTIDETGVVHDVYRCRKCRQVLFCSGNFIEQLTNQDVSALPKSDYWAESAGGMEYSRASQVAAFRGGTLPGPSTVPDASVSLRVEPVDWMQFQMEAKRSGKLTCPQCASKIGSWDWGSVDAWSSIFITPSKVERLATS